MIYTVKFPYHSITFAIPTKFKKSSHKFFISKIVSYIKPLPYQISKSVKIINWDPSTEPNDIKTREEYIKQEKERKATNGPKPAYSNINFTSAMSMISYYGLLTVYTTPSTGNKISPEDKVIKLISSIWARSAVNHEICHTLLDFDNDENKVKNNNDWTINFNEKDLENIYSKRNPEEHWAVFCEYLILLKYNSPYSRQETNDRLYQIQKNYPKRYALAILVINKIMDDPENQPPKF